MKKYFKRLRENPGFEMVIVVMILSTLAGATNKSASSLGSGALFGFLFSVIFILTPLLISNVRIDRKRASKIKNKTMENTHNKWKPKPGEDYYYADFNSHGIESKKSTNWGALINVTHLETNNCYQTKEGADAAITRIKTVLKSTL